MITGFDYFRVFEMGCAVSLVVLGPYDVRDYNDLYDEILDRVVNRGVKCF